MTKTHEKPHLMMRWALAIGGVGHVTVEGIRRGSLADMEAAYNAVVPFADKMHKPHLDLAAGTIAVQHELDGSQFHRALVEALHLG